MNKRTELLLYIAQVNVDIILITEVLPKSTRTPVDIAEIKLPGFDCHTNFNGDTHLGRGVAVYIRDSLNSSKCAMTLNFEESVFCEIALKGTDKLLVGCIYRSPNSTTENNIKLNESLPRICSRSTHLLIAGDFNFPEINWQEGTTPRDENSKSSRFMEAVRDSFLFQHVQEPTHYRGQETPHLLDLVFSNEEGMVRDLEHRAPLGKSHHHVLQFDFNCYVEEEHSRDSRFCFSKGDFTQMEAEILGRNWVEEFSEQTAEELWSALEGTILHAMEEYIPKYQVHKTRKHRPKWFNDSVKIKVKEKQKCFARYMETRDTNDYQNYARARNQVKWETRKAVKIFERKIAEEAKRNPKGFFAYARGKMRTKENVAELRDNEGTLATSDADKAEMLNRQFCSVFTQEDVRVVPELPPRQYQRALQDMTITPDMVKKKLLKLNPNKSPGPDSHHPMVFMNLAECLASPLASLFSKCMREGHVPQRWKEAAVTPIYKKGDKAKPANYRPVSLTSIACKLLESFVRDAIMKHLEENHLLADCQHGFVKGRSCSTNLLTALDDWTETLDNGEALDVIYFDFAKAFDTVPHQRLLNKLKAHGITGHIHEWIKSFLLGRRQLVKVNGKRSTWGKVESGIPQGSVLGPCLFVVFINDMHENIHNKIKLFADDTKLYGPAEQSMQEDVSRLMQWSTIWQLKFNRDKCKVIHFGRSNPGLDYTMSTENHTSATNAVSDEPEHRIGETDQLAANAATQVQIHGQLAAGAAHDQDQIIEDLQNVTIARAVEEKDLGVLVDIDLKFSLHVEKQVNKANRILGMIRRSYVYLDAGVMRLLFCSLVRPHLEFANVVWSPRLVKDKNLIEAVQRRATKMIPGLRELPYEERLRATDMPSLDYRRRRGDMIEVYKYLHGIYTIKEELLPLERSAVNTRGHPFKLKKRTCRLETRRNFFNYRVVNPWNALPESIVSAPSLNSFKARLDKHWINYKYIVQ